MSGTVSSLKLDFLTSHRLEPFVLVSGDDQGSLPLRVYPMMVSAWSRKLGIYDAVLDGALRLKSPGKRRIRLYCPVRSSMDVRLLVHGGRHRYLGRRKEPIIETLTWTRSKNDSLGFYYDRPEVTILEHTRFFDTDGHETSLPDYVPSQGIFRHAQEVTGAMVVEYRPGFSLYEIEYDLGDTQVTEQAFREIKLAWLAGNIRDATIPEVRIIALSGQNATQLSFSRSFWPEHSGVRQWFQEDISEPAMTVVAGGFRFDPGLTDPCWLRCKEKIRPHDNYLTQEDRRAILACVEQGKNPTYHYVERKRTVQTERIHSQNDPDTYVDVERPVELVFRFQRADDSPCVDPAPPNCCPELVLRFKSNSRESA